MSAKIKKVKEIKFSTDNVLIAYDRNGHILFEGNVKDIPEHLKEYYVWYKSTHKNINKTYINVTEDKGWMN